MDNKLAKLFNDFDSGNISRRKLLKTLGLTAGIPVAAALSPALTALGQGGCRDGYGQGRCMLTKDVATAAIKPVFDSTGWKTVGQEHLTFEIGDYKKEAAFYVALMGWTLRSDNGKQAVLDMGPWGSAIFKEAAPGAFPAPAAAAAGAAAAGGRGGGGRGNATPAHAAVRSFGWVIEPWNAKTVEAELKKRGMTPKADNDGKGFESFWVKDADNFDLQICNGGGLYKARKTAATAKLSEPAPFDSTGWKTIWLDHLSFGVADYKKAVSFYSNLLGWKGSYDEGTQNEVMIGDIGDAIVRGGNENDPNFGKPQAGRGGGEGAAAGGTTVHIDHISFGISPWDVDGVRAELEKRSLPVQIDTSSAHPGPDGKMVSDDVHQAAFQSYHTRTPNGYNLQISWMSKDKRLALATAVKPKG